MDEETKLAVNSFIEKNLSVTSSLHQDGLSSRSRRAIQHFSLLRLKDSAQQTLYEIVLRHAHSAEHMCPGGGLSFLRRVVGKKDTVDVEKPRNRRDVMHLLSSCGHDSFVASLLMCILEMSDMTSKISLKKSDSRVVYIEKTQGYTFAINSLLNNNFEHRHVRVACIDGYIESVSEVHHLFESLSQSSLPCLIVCRGMSDDVVHTIKVNNDRSTLCVSSVAVPFDIENSNKIVDIAVASGTDVVSSLKGQVISSLRLDDLGKVDDVRVVGNSLKICNKTATMRVAQHVSQIQKTISDKDESVSSVYHQRIRDLSSNNIDVCIPDDINYFSRSQQLSEGIRIISSLLSKKYDMKSTVDSHYESYLMLINSTVSLLL